ncbi:MAG: complement resistance protein TraT [Actinomycetota bacterium]|nr:complement resistance protein TraT [Actinomycetota bacterium]
MIVFLAQVNVSPTTEGMPGGALVQKLLNWTQMFALWGSLAAILVGAAMYGLAREGGSYSNASRGKGLALGGMVGAILAGIAPAAVNLLFQAART